MSDEFAARAVRRANWPIRRYELGSEPDDDLSTTTTVAERIAMVWQLTLDAWASSGLPMPTYDRHHIPSQIVRGMHGGDSGAE